MALHGLMHDSALLYWAKRGARSATSGFSGGRGGRGSMTTIFKFQKLVIYKPILHRELNTRSGGLWKELHRRGNLAVLGAKAQVGVKTGALKRSIHMKHLGNPAGQYLWIGSNKSYAEAHHNGTKPHTIEAKSPSQPLVFRSGSRIVRTPVVFHPGTRANPYLASQLRHFRM